MRGAAFVDPDLDIGPEAGERARRAGVIEMDVGERDRARAPPPETLEQRRDARGRAGVDQDVADDPRTDHVRPIELKNVDLADLG